jgi:iron complex outermembrane receptor protein
VVTGIRASLRSAMDVKRNSLQVVDTISAEDIGDFPDKNLSEALQRVTGVQISRQDGEGRGVSIRGADPSLNRVEINGSSALSLTVGGSDRAVDFRDIPVEFVSRLDVVKSPTADMAEGGIGGTVRVITRRPFDSKTPYLAGSVQGVYSNLAKEYDPKFALIGSKTFFDDKFGVLLSGTWEKRHLNSNNARTTGWIRRAADRHREPARRRAAAPTSMATARWTGSPRSPPDHRSPGDRAEGAQRRAGMASDRQLQGLFRRHLRHRQGRREQHLPAAGRLGRTDRLQQDHPGRGQHGQPHRADQQTAFPMDLAYRNILGDLKRTQYTTALGGEWKRDKWTFDARFDYSNAEVQNNEINSTATVFGVPRAIVDYTGGQRAPNFSFPGLDVTSGQGVNRLDAVFNPRNNTSDETAEQFNVTYRPDVSWLTSIKAGVQGGSSRPTRSCTSAPRA